MVMSKGEKTMAKTWVDGILESGEQDKIAWQVQQSMWFYDDSCECRMRYLQDAKWWYQHLNKQGKEIVKNNLNERLHNKLISVVKNEQIKPHLF